MLKRQIRNRADGCRRFSGSPNLPMARKAQGKKRTAPISDVVRFRVEIWRIDPEVRLAAFPLAYEKKKFRCADILWQIADALVGWLDAKIPKHDRPLADVPLADRIWQDEDRMVKDDEDVPVLRS